MGAKALCLRNMLALDSEVDFPLGRWIPPPPPHPAPRWEPPTKYAVGNRVKIFFTNCEYLDLEEGY